MSRTERASTRPVLLAAGLGAFLAQLDGTVMNVTLPALSRAFNTTRLADVQPVITAYLIATIALLPLLGTLADRWGRKRLFMAGFAIFGIASLLCSLAPTLGLLVAFRVLQAIGGAILSGASLALVATGAGNQRGRSLGKLAIVFALSGLLGPPLGGGLVQAFGWRSVFWLNLPLVAAGLCLAARLLPADKPGGRTGRVDATGAALFATSVALLAAALTLPGERSLGPLNLGWPLLLAGVICVMLLLLWERRAARRGRDPLLDLALLATPAYGLGLVAAFLSNGVTIGLFVLVPFWLAQGWHVSSGVLGLVFLPVALALGGLAPLAGKRSDVIGSRALTSGGMAIGVLASLILVWQASDLLWPALLPAMFGLGAASGLFAAPNNNAILAAVGEDRLAAASSMLSAARTLGVILGVSTASTLFDLLRSAHGANDAARILFAIAAVLYAGNSVLCWRLRGAPRARTALPPVVPRTTARRAVEPR